MSKAELFLEIGSEEIPAAEVVMAVESLRDTLASGLEELRLSSGTPSVYATPRRLVVVIPDVATAQDDLTKEVMGPPARVAYKDGKPTKAAEGFAKGLGLTVEQLSTKATDKGDYLAAVVEEKGQPTTALLPELILTAIKKIPFKRTMRWGDGTEAFVRPMQWIVALLGDDVLDVAFADVKAGRQSQGHRFMAPEPFDVRSSTQYLEEIRKRHVLVDVAERKKSIVESASALAKTVGGQLRDDDELIDEVVQLVENPVPMLTHFDEKYLEIPDEVLISEMREHQRYLSLVDAKGRLMPNFVVIGNTAVLDDEVVKGGYRRVLSARFEDGRFFYNDDQKTKLIDRAEDLKRMQFHRALGSTFEKVERVAKLSVWLAAQLDGQLGDGIEAKGLAETQDLHALARSGGSDFASKLARAAYLAKSDLTTRMVFEFPELQGTMGRSYAEIDGESKDVAASIEEHYLPKGAGDDLPEGVLGALVGLADRLDTIAGIFSVSKGPTGAADPFGLRRAALGIIRILRGRGWRISLEQAIAQSASLVADKRKKKTADEVESQVSEFFRGRLRGVMTGTDEVGSDEAEAVLSAGYDDIVEVSERGRALSRVREGPEFEAIANAVKRVENILKKAEEGGALDPAALEDENEKQLFDALETQEVTIAAHVKQREYEAAFKVIAELRPALGKFFGGGDYGKGVLVMHDDPKVRTNRVALVRRVSRLFSPLADFTKLS